VDACRTASAQRASGFVSRRARGHNVVDQQDRAAFGAGVPAHRKDAAYVLATAGRGLTRLVRGVAEAAQPSRETRDLQSSRQSAGDRRALVVAAPPAPPPMQWDRHNRVHRQGSQTLSIPLGPQLAEQFRQALARVLLQSQDRVA
jgi:hypothetical protein